MGRNLEQDYFMSHDLLWLKCGEKEGLATYIVESIFSQQMYFQASVTRDSGSRVYRVGWTRFRDGEISQGFYKGQKWFRSLERADATALGLAGDEMFFLIKQTQRAMLSASRTIDMLTKKDRKDYGRPARRVPKKREL